MPGWLRCMVPVRDGMENMLDEVPESEWQLGCSTQTQQ